MNNVGKPMSYTTHVPGNGNHATYKKKVMTNGDGASDRQG